jgi:serine phosphatase RsbU (regulator of sigma subunit)
MQKVKFILVLTIWIAASNLVEAQSVVKLLELIETETNPNTLAHLNFKLGKFYIELGAFAKAKEKFLAAISADKTDTKLLSESQFYLAKCFINLQSYDSAQKYADNFFELTKEKPKFDTLRANLLNQMLEFGIKERQFESTLFYLGVLSSFYANKRDTAQIIRTKNFIGYCLTEVNRLEESLDYLEQSLEMAKNKRKYIAFEINALCNKATALVKLEKPKEAELAFQTALQLALTTNNPSFIASCRNYLSAVKHLNDQPFEAIVEAERALNLALSTSDRQNTIDAYKNLVAIYAGIENYKQSQAYDIKLREILDQIKSQVIESEKAALKKQIETEKQESEVKELLSEKQKQDAEKKRTELEQKQQQQNLKLKDQELELLRKDRQLQESNLRANILEKQRLQQILAAEQQENELERQRLMTYAAQKEAEKLDLLAKSERKAKEIVEKEKKTSEEQRLLQSQNITFSNRILFLTVLLALLISIVLIIVYINLRRFKSFSKQLSEKNTQIALQNSELSDQKNAIESINKQLRLKNESVTSSLVYASRIQSALLPLQFGGSDKIKSFVIYKPKDIVSGDFYWTEKIDDVIFMAVADCTGHGVPGAMMSMLGISTLNSIIFDKKIHEPDMILTILNLEVIAALEQENSISSDGMDILLLAWDTKTKQVKFASSKINLIYVSSGEIFELSGDRYPIGFAVKDLTRTFQVHTLDLELIDTLYLTSDGYKDQFGGDKNQKFGKKRLMALLKDIHLRPLEDQKEILERTIVNWKGELPQTDDITVIGLRFKDAIRGPFVQSNSQSRLFA